MTRGWFGLEVPRGFSCQRAAPQGHHIRPAYLCATFLSLLMMGITKGHYASHIFPENTCIPCASPGFMACTQDIVIPFLTAGSSTSAAGFVRA